MFKPKLVKKIEKKLIQLKPVSPKKVVGIGLPRTGTTTLGQCFKQLGYKHRSFDMQLAAQVKRNELENTLAEAEKFETFEDWPWFLLYKELDQKFPNSKFILTIRKDVETYVASLKKHHAHRGVTRKDAVKPDWWDDVFGFEPHEWNYEDSVERYEKHNREVLEYFKDRPNDLLVVCWEKGDGWEKLCTFLNRPCPNEPFPHRGKLSSAQKA